jgi:hypothetical protein
VFYVIAKAHRDAHEHPNDPVLDCALAIALTKMARIAPEGQYTRLEYKLTANRKLRHKQASNPATRGVDRVMSLFLGYAG